MAGPQVDPVLSQKAAQAFNILIWIGMVVGGSVLLACSYIYLKRKKEHRRLLTGELMAPGEGPETTLAVTDIQVSRAPPQGPRALELIYILWMYLAVKRCKTKLN